MILSRLYIDFTLRFFLFLFSGEVPDHKEHQNHQYDTEEKGEDASGKAGHNIRNGGYGGTGHRVRKLCANVVYMDALGTRR